MLETPDAQAVRQTETVSRWPSKTVLALLALIVIGGVALRAWNVLERPLWEDEAYTWKDSRVPLWWLVWWKHDPAHGPASHLLVRGSMELFGTDDVWAMRLPAFLCGILCIGVAFRLGRTIHGDALGLATAALVAVDPNMVDQSQQARMYTMLALASMLVLDQAIRVLRVAPEQRRPWIVLGLLLAAQFWINFGAIAPWAALAVTAAATALTAYRAGGPGVERARRIARGTAIAYGWALLLSARGLWRMIVFIRSDRGITTTSAAETLRAIWRGFEQVTGSGSAAVVVLAAAIVGLCVLGRRARIAALVLAATALVTLVMIYAGRSVHHMIALRYFTVMQPAIWIALAALVVLLPNRLLRCGSAAGLIALLAVQAWQSAHVDHWVDVNTWRYTRAASRFIAEERQPGDLYLCTPITNFGTVASYYGLFRPDDERLQHHMQDRAPLPPQLDGRTTWIQAFMFDARAETELQAFLDVWNTGRASPDGDQRVLAAVRDKGLALARISNDRFETWVYDAQRDDFRPAGTITLRADEPVRAASGPVPAGPQ